MIKDSVDTMAALPCEVVKQLVRTITPEKIECLEADMLNRVQAKCPLIHSFAPGLYVRQIVMAKGLFIIGHEHNYEHFNFVMAGRATVLMNGELHEIEAPCIFVSQAGVRKVLLIHETMIWATAHVTDCRDLKLLEAELITKSSAFLRHEEIELLKDRVEIGTLENMTGEST
jgi:hypothetical protein